VLGRQEAAPEMRACFDCPSNSPSPLCLAHSRFVHSEVMRDLMPNLISHHLFEPALAPNPSQNGR